MRSKYGNKKAKHNGMIFESRRERNRYIILSALQRAGEISDLRMQVSFELIPAVYETVEKQLKTKVKMVERCVQKATHYIADFVYKDKDGNIVVEDSKGMKTKEYILKKKMMRAFLGIEIKEV